MIIGSLNFEIRADVKCLTLVVATVRAPGVRGGFALETAVSAEQLHDLAECFEGWRRAHTPKPVKEAVMDQALRSFRPGKRTRAQ